MRSLTPKREFLVSVPWEGSSFAVTCLGVGLACLQGILPSRPQGNTRELGSVGRFDPSEPRVDNKPSYPSFRGGQTR